jgi:phage shock protein A
MSLTKDDLQAITKITEAVVNGAIDKLALQVGEGFNEMGERLDRVEADVAVLKTDVATLKTDVAVLKTDVSTLKTDMREVKWHLSDTVTRTEFLGLRERVALLEDRRQAAH